MIHKAKHTILDFLPALKFPNFRLYILGQGISYTGTWLAVIAEQWLIYPKLTNNPSNLGLVQAANLIPTALLVLFAGVISDRVNKKILLIVSQIVYVTISFILAYLVFSNQIKIWHIFMAAAITGTVFAFELPSRNTLMLDLVDKEHFSSALSLQSAIFNSARAIGPALAGFLIAIIGMAQAYFWNGVSFLAVIAAVLLMQLPPHHKQNDSATLVEGFKEGFRFIHARKSILLLLVMLGIQAIFISPVTSLLPVYAHDIFKQGEIGFGFLQTAFGLGAITSAFGFAKVFAKVENKARLVRFAVLISTLCILAFAYNRFYPFALIILAIFGFATSMFFSVASTLVQSNTPKNIRGRVTGYWSFIFFGGLPLGALMLSFLLQYFPTPTVVFSTAAMYGILSFFLLRQKDLQQLAVEHHED